MITIAEPLLPPEVDLKGFDYMPLQIERLLRSRTWIRAKANPALGFYSLNLWATSWHEGPPGSLQHDDVTLADYARCTPIEWMKIRDEALATWALCSADDRLYHPVVCELALSAFLERLKYRKANAKRHHKQFKFNIDVATYQRRISDAAAMLKETAKNATSQIFKQAAKHANGKDNPATLLQGEGEGKKVEGKEGSLFGESLPHSDKESPRIRRERSRAKSASPATSAASGAACLAKDWKPSDDQVAYAVKMGLTSDEADREAHKFLTYWTAGAGEGTRRTPKGWRQSWLTWVGKALKDIPRERGGGSAQGTDYGAIRKRVEAEDAAKKLRGAK